MNELHPKLHLPGGLMAKLSRVFHKTVSIEGVIVESLECSSTGATKNYPVIRLKLLSSYFQDLERYRMVAQQKK